MARYEILFQCGLTISGEDTAPWAEENLARQTCPVKTCHCPRVGIFWPNPMHASQALSRGPGRPKKPNPSHE